MFCYFSTKHPCSSTDPGPPLVELPLGQELREWDFAGGLRSVSFWSLDSVDFVAHNNVHAA